MSNMTPQIAEGLLQSYQSTINSYDEVIDHNGQVKPYWKSIFNTLEEIGLEKLGLRNQEIIHKLKENGVTYNVYNSNDATSRAWKLDPIPFLLHENEWKTIEKGLQQRALLLELILKDIYGSKLLLKNNIIPAELIYDNSGFIRPCFDINPNGNNRLMLYAADIARGPDGNMWLLDNRTQSPSGSGYALENRTVMSKIFPELNKNIYRSRLSPYFSEIQQSIANLNNSSGDVPNVVVLTPGLGNETYFEHSYLSSYLGYTLVQGNDLLVRDGYVWLKSIDQLERVDVIIRRVDDAWCDPLELKQQSLLGIPGLLQVMRLGNVSVLNAPGTSAVENHGLMAFMQNICRFFLNEPLLMNSIATWWCGQPKELNFVLANLPKLIIKKTNRKQGFRSIYGRLLNNQELADLKTLILKNPKEYVAQEEVSLSTTPSFVDGKLEPRLAALRAFLVWDGQEFKAMQGGLTRSSAVKDKFEISNQLGGLSKDTWIVRDTPNEYQEKIILRKSQTSIHSNTLTSRNAENLFWVGRMTERTMALDSFLKIIFNRLNENANYKGSKHPEYLISLLKSLTHLTQTYPGFAEVEDNEDEIFDNPLIEIQKLIGNVQKTGSLTFNIQILLNTINQVSEKWNHDTRRIINLLEDSLEYLKKADVVTTNKLSHSLDKLYIRLFSFYGNIYETIPRDNGFYLFEAGKNIERILSLISVLKTTFGVKNTQDVEAVLMEAVLENHHLLAQYRYTYKSHLSLVTVLNLLFLEKNLPYTLSYLLDRLTECLSKLPKTIEPNRLSVPEKMVLEANTLIKLIDAETLVKADEETAVRTELNKTLNQVEELISSVTVQLTGQYFNHSTEQYSILDTLEKSESDEI